MTSVLIASALLFAEPQFPRDFVGIWQGDLEWTKTSDSKKQVIKMTFSILPTKETDVYSYRITYGKDPVRSYLLRGVKGEPNHWIVDEGDGILLDSYWVGGSLISSFLVSGNQIVTNLRREGKDLIWTTVSYKAGTAVSGGVTSNVVQSLQRAKLVKKKG